MSENGNRTQHSHFLRSLNVVNAFSVRDVPVPISRAPEARHLLLTGPNGSGKSTILRALKRELLDPGNYRAEYEETRQWLLAATTGVSESPNASPERTRHLDKVRHWKTELNRLGGQGHVEAAFGDFPSEAPFVLHVPADRKLGLTRPMGPRALGNDVFERGNIHVEETLQHLVNLKSEAALAKDDGDLAEAEELAGRVKDFERGMRVFFGDQDTHLEFDRRAFDFTIRSGVTSNNFHHLPDGLASAVYILGGLTLASEGQRRRGEVEGRGWALLDEPELHLHVELQERILPFLLEAFPNVQFIVATHSPAVLASVPNATIFDLRTREAYPSEELRGVRYGTILTEHFGISSDFDLETTRALERLYGLYDSNPEPGSAAFGEMRILAASLGDIPHVLVSAARKLTSQASDSDD